MMSVDDTSGLQPDPAIPLEDDEAIEWLGRPRTTVILPSVTIAILLAAVGTYGATRFSLLALVLVPLGLAIPAIHYLVVTNIQYAVTDRAIYAKRGVLGRSVTQANLETVQNSAYSQSITGSLFGYGTVEFEIAGGNDLAFSDIRDPEPVRALVDRATRNQDGLTDERRSGRLGIPGSLQQWRDVRTEIQAIRRTLQRLD